MIKAQMKLYGKVSEHVVRFGHYSFMSLLLQLSFNALGLSLRCPVTWRS